jgi:cell division protein ZapA
MPDVNLHIAGRGYTLACKEGGEAHLAALAAEIDYKAQQLIDQLGPMNEGRLMLMSALLLADELHEIRKAGGAPQPAAPDSRLEALAARAEALVARLDSASRS